MGSVNEELIEKTLESSDFFAGGQINSTQQSEFVRLVKDFSVMIGMVRFVDMPTKTYQIDKIHLGEPITRGIDENTDALTNLAQPKMNQITLTTSKIKTAYAITTEALQVALTQADLEDTVMEMVTKRYSTDVEILAISGDDSVTGTTPYDSLIKVLDGWRILTNDAQIVNAGGAEIAKSLWTEALRKMPQQYLQDPDLRWLMSRILNIDWLDTIADRETALGDAAFRGDAPPILGVPASIIPLIPSDLSVSVADATSATVVGTQYGPFEIRTGTNDLINIDVDNGGAHEMTLPQGVWEAIRIAAFINADSTFAAAGLVASDDDGKLKLVSASSTGTASEIDIQATSTPAQAAYTTLGLTVAVTTGAAAGAGTEDLGTFVWLANPMNFIFGMLDQTRIFSEFNKDYDRVEVVMYNEVAVQVENLESIVRIDNIKRKSL